MEEIQLQEKRYRGKALEKAEQEGVYFMNILFFLTPKSDVMYLEENDTVEQGIGKLQRCGYTAVPLISREGTYIGTVTEGDFLRLMISGQLEHASALRTMPMRDLARKTQIDAVKISCQMEDAIEMAMKQNFVPVVDDKETFIGIITRKDLLNHMYCFYKKEHSSKARVVFQTPIYS